MADFEDAWARDMRDGIDGDAAAYRRVLDALAPYLRRMIRHALLRYGRGPEDVEDIVQETLLAIHLKRHTWDASRPLVPWVRAITSNKLVDALRRHGTRTIVPIEDVAETLSDGVDEPRLSPGDIDRLLGRLGGRQHDVLRALLVDGSSVREVADRLAMTEVTVRVTLHRGLKALAAALKERDT